MLSFLKKLDEIKKDDGVNVASEYLAQGFEGLTEEDAKAGIALLTETVNQGAFKGKLTPQQIELVSQGILVLGKTGKKLFGGLFKGKKSK